MSAALGINEYYLPKIIKPMRDKKWITSMTGSVGGFILSGKPEEITLLDIIEVMEGPTEISLNLSEDRSYSWNSAVSDSVQQVYQTYQAHVIQYFSSITLKDLLDKGAKAL
jgi:Rrf2 family protein